MANNVAIFENDLRKWIATLAASSWTPVDLLEEAVKDKVLCFPLAKLEVNKQGKVLQVNLKFRLIMFSFRSHVENHTR